MKPLIFRDNTADRLLNRLGLTPERTGARVSYQSIINDLDSRHIATALGAYETIRVITYESGLVQFERHRQLTGTVRTVTYHRGGRDASVQFHDRDGPIGAPNAVSRHNPQLFRDMRHASLLTYEVCLMLQRPQPPTRPPLNPGSLV